MAGFDYDITMGRCTGALDGGVPMSHVDFKKE